MFNHSLFFRCLFSRRCVFAYSIIVSLALSANAFAAADPLANDAPGIVQVRAHKNAKLTTVVSGFVVHAEGSKRAVLTSAHALRRANRFTVIAVPSGSEIVATLLWRDEAADVALLEAPGLNAKPLVFAAPGLAQGRSVATAWRRADGQLQTARGSLGVVPSVPSATEASDAEGTAGNAQGAADTTQPSASYEHNAMISADGYGAPLLDECHRVIGVNHEPRERGAFGAPRADDPQGVVHAAAVSAVLALLKAKGVAYKTEESICTPSDEAARAAAEAKAREAAEATEAAATAAAAVTVAEARAEESQQSEQAARMLAERERKYLYIGGAAGALLALVALFLFILRGRAARRRVDAAENRTAAARRALHEASAPADPDARPGWSFASDDGGATFYASHALLSASEQGLRIGRNAETCHGVINAPEVSREHCRVFLDDGRLMLEDLKSANGTYLGARQLQSHAPQEIRDGERITLGNTVLTVVYVAD